MWPRPGVQRLCTRSRHLLCRLCSAPGCAHCFEKPGSRSDKLHLCQHPVVAENTKDHALQLCPGRTAGGTGSGASDTETQPMYCQHQIMTVASPHGKGSQEPHSERGSSCPGTQYMVSVFQVQPMNEMTNNWEEELTVSDVRVAVWQHQSPQWTVECVDTSRTGQQQRGQRSYQAGHSKKAEDRVSSLAFTWV